MTASFVLSKMQPIERIGFLAGVVEGLAYTRYAKDGKTTDGMSCIYDWYYQGPESFDAVLDALERFPNYTVGAIIAALVEKECVP